MLKVNDTVRTADGFGVVVKRGVVRVQGVRHEYVDVKLDEHETVLPYFPAVERVARVEHAGVAA